MNTIAAQQHVSTAAQASAWIALVIFTVFAILLIIGNHVAQTAKKGKGRK